MLIMAEFTTNPVINKTNDEGDPFIPASDLGSLIIVWRTKLFNNHQLLMMQYTCQSCL